jgi:hypothetical protein
MRLRTLTLLMALCFAAGAFALDVPLEYERYADSPGRGYRPHARAGVRALVDRPPGDWKLPELVSDIPVYGVVNLVDSERLLVLDRQKQSDAFFNRVYFDTNGNGDLTDDTPIDSQDSRGGNSNFAHFNPVDFKTTLDGKQMPYSLRISCYCWAENDQQKLTREVLKRQCRLMVDVNCAYRGQFSLDGTTYHVWLADANGNGRFDDTVRLPSIGNQGSARPVYLQGDDIYLSTKRGIEYYDSMTLSDWLSLNGRLYEVAIDVPGKKMSLTPARVPMTRAKLPMEAERLSLFDKGQKRSVMLFRPGKAAMIPEGSYGVMGYCALRNDEQGDLWRVIASATSDTPFVEVKGAKGAALAFGEPFTPEAVIPGGQRVGDGAANVQMTLNIKGSANEQIRDISHLQGNKTNIPLSGNRPKEAKFKIVMPDGEVAAQGKFDYG